MKSECDRLKMLLELSELVRNSEEMTLRGLYSENYELKQELKELKNQLQHLRTFRTVEFGQ